MFQPVRQRLDRLAHALLPAPERTDRHALMRAKFALTVLPLFTLLGLVRGLTLLRYGVPVQGVILLGLSVLALGLLAVPRLAGSMAAAGHAGAALVFVALTSALLHSGGVRSPVLLGVGVVPLLAVFLTGRRGGSVWMVIVAVTIVVFAAVDRLGYSVPIRFPPESWASAIATGALLLAFICFGIATAYERERNEAEGELSALDRARLDVEQRVQAANLVHQRRFDDITLELAHEANNALTYVLGGIAYAEVSVSERSDVSAALGEARIGAQRLRDVVRDVCAIAVSAPIGPAEPIDLGGAVASAISKAMPDLVLAGIRVEWRAPPERSVAKTNPVALDHALVGILTGAGDDSVLRIQLEADPPTISITASRRRAGRTLGMEAANCLLSEQGCRLTIDDDELGWTAVIELPCCD